MVGLVSIRAVHTPVGHEHNAFGAPSCSKILAYRSAWAHKIPGYHGVPRGVTIRALTHRTAKPSRGDLNTWPLLSLQRARWWLQLEERTKQLHYSATTLQPGSHVFIEHTINLKPKLLPQQEKASVKVCQVYLTFTDSVWLKVAGTKRDSLWADDKRVDKHTKRRLYALQ